MNIFSKMSQSSITNLSIDGHTITISGDKLVVDGIQLSLSELKGGVPSKPLDLSSQGELFQEGVHQVNSLKFEIDSQGKLVSLSESGTGNTIIQGNVSIMNKSGSGDIEVQGDINILNKSGSGDIYKKIK